MKGELRDLTTCRREPEHTQLLRLPRLLREGKCWGRRPELKCEELSVERCQCWKQVNSLSSNTVHHFLHPRSRWAQEGVVVPMSRSCNWRSDWLLNNFLGFLIFKKCLGFVGFLGTWNWARKCWHRTFYLFVYKHTFKIHLTSPLLQPVPRSCGMQIHAWGVQFYHYVRMKDGRALGAGTQLWCSELIVHVKYHLHWVDWGGGTGLQAIWLNNLYSTKL